LALLPVAAAASDERPGEAFGVPDEAYTAPELVSAIVAPAVGDDSPGSDRAAEAVGSDTPVEEIDGPLASRACAIALIEPGFVVWWIDRDRDRRFDMQPQLGLMGDRFLSGEPLAEWRNGCDELVVTRPHENNWDLRWFVLENSGCPGFPGNRADRVWGLKDDRPLIGNWLGDGDRAAVKQADFMIWDDGDLVYEQGIDRVFNWPTSIGADDEIMAINFNGDQWEDVAVWRNASGNWELYAGYWMGPSREASVVTQFGLPGDIPFAGDIDGDGFDDLCVFRPLAFTVFVNYREATGPNDPYRGYAPGDVDKKLKYKKEIKRINKARHIDPLTPWKVAALAPNIG